MGERGYGGTGISEREVKKIQIEAAARVEEKRAAIQRELEEKKRQREFTEAANYRDMRKEDLTRARFAKR